MKKTILFSTLLAVFLNIVQFVRSQPSPEAAFSPSWAQATPTPNPGAPVLKAASATPATASTVAEVEAKLQQAGLKPNYAELYLRVQAATGTPWQILASVHRIETGQRGDTAVTSYAGAVGPMQFMPATFKAYAVDGDSDGVKNINDLEDAMFSAGRYLAANGAARGNYSNALYRYNHSWTYVNSVLATARKLGLS